MRRLRNMLVVTALVASAASVLLANGGGYSFGVKFTGGIAPFQASGTEHVRIVREDLVIQLRRTDASVAVSYVMRNLDDNPVQVWFGFPVEAIYADDLLDEESPDTARPAEGTVGARQAELLRGIQQLKGYTVTADGTPVRSEFLVEPFATGRVRPFPGCEVLKGIAGWMVSEVTFPPSKAVSLRIDYAAAHGGDGTFVSDDDEASPLSFHYRLSTGAVWNGPIGTGTVNIGVDGIPASEVEVVKPRDRFRRVGDRWVWEFRDLEPTLADDITVDAVPGYFKTTRQEYSPDSRGPGSERTYLRRLGKWAQGHQRFKATASSFLATAGNHSYRPQQLAEPGPASPWCEGVSGMGVGEYVEVVPEAPARLMALGLYPGFQDYSRPALFERNARPSRVEIQVNGETTFTASVGDKNLAEQIIPLLGYSKPVSRLRITLKEVYPGTTFEDTCITKLVLYDLLPGDPKVGHAR